MAVGEVVADAVLAADVAVQMSIGALKGHLWTRAPGPEPEAPA